MSVRVRFAPSPTGPLHIGGARSALFNWLFARRYNGTFLLRIEDTDLERSNKQSEQNILSSLKWLGLGWDEGVGVGGSHGPYRQTERLDLYNDYVDRLLASGHAYPCYCTGEELEKERQQQMDRGEMVRYSGKCRDLTEADRNRLESEGRVPAIRFRVPVFGAVIVDDLVRGRVSFDCGEMGDYIIRKSDGIPTYNFAVVIDDATMEISHVIRGEEHLSNTPRQVLIYQALDLKMPKFAHVSLILGKDRSKMSKRHGATSIEQYKSKGYLPEALVNFMALLGWSPGGEDELLDPVEICKQFSLDRVAKNPAVFDLEKLDWLNGHYIRNISLGRITDLAIPFLQKAGYLSGEVSESKYGWLLKVMDVVRDYLTCMEEVGEHAEMFFAARLTYGAEALDVLRRERVGDVLEGVRVAIMNVPRLEEANIKGLLNKTSKELGIRGKNFFIPVRVALTGKERGPDLDKLIPVLGKDKVLSRLAAAMNT